MEFKFILICLTLSVSHTWTSFKSLMSQKADVKEISTEPSPCKLTISDVRRTLAKINTFEKAVQAANLLDPIVFLRDMKLFDFGIIPNMNLAIAFYLIMIIRIDQNALDANLIGRLPELLSIDSIFALMPIYRRKQFKLEGFRPIISAMTDSFRDRDCIRAWDGVLHKGQGGVFSKYLILHFLPMWLYLKINQGSLNEEGLSEEIRNLFGMFSIDTDLKEISEELIAFEIESQDIEDTVYIQLKAFLSAILFPICFLDTKDGVIMIGIVWAFVFVMSRIFAS